MPVAGPALVHSLGFHLSKNTGFLPAPSANVPLPVTQAPPPRLKNPKYRRQAPAPVCLDRAAGFTGHLSSSTDVRRAVLSFFSISGAYLIPLRAFHRQCGSLKRSVMSGIESLLHPLAPDDGIGRVLPYFGGMGD
jgi:hypothetical protein